MKLTHALLIIFIFLSLLFSGCESIPTQEGGITYTINNLSYVPLIAVTSAQNLRVEYDTFARTVELNRDAHKVNMMVGDSLVLVDGVPAHLRHPVDFYRGAIVVPVTFREQILDGLFKEYPLRKRTGIPVLRIKKVVIDAGHGGDDPGALGRSGLQEKEINLDIAKRLSAILRSAGLTVSLTRSTDKFIQLGRRVDIANDANADLFVSIHSNASRVRTLNGFEVYYVAPTVSDSKRGYLSAQDTPINLDNFQLASNALDLKAIVWDMIYTSNRSESVALSRSICRVMDSNSDARILGVKSARFEVLRGTQMPAVLVETGFVSNPTEERLLKSSAYRQKVAENVAQGILDYARDYSNTEVAQR